MKESIRKKNNGVNLDGLDTTRIWANALWDGYTEVHNAKLRTPRKRLFSQDPAGPGGGAPGAAIAQRTLMRLLTRRRQAKAAIDTGVEAGAPRRPNGIILFAIVDYVCDGVEFIDSLEI